MKINSDYVLRPIADSWIVFPMTKDFSTGVLTLNGSGAFLWGKLEQGAEFDGLVKALTDEYEVTEAEATADVDAFIQQLRAAGCLEDQ